MNVYRPAIIKIGEHSVSKNRCQKLPIIKIASQLNFNILKQLLKDLFTRYMFWLKLHLICTFQKQSYQWMLF